MKYSILCLGLPAILIWKNPVETLVFGQAFFEKGCATTVAPVDHADRARE